VRRSAGKLYAKLQEAMSRVSSPKSPGSKEKSDLRLETRELGFKKNLELKKKLIKEK
jgi:hypothetical protein